LLAATADKQTGRKETIFLYKQIFVISRCGATIVLRQVEVLIKSGGNNSKGASCQSEHWSNVSRLKELVFRTFKLIKNFQ